MNKKTTVDTWLPVFSGFYGTIWESDSDEEMEIDNINELRKDAGLDPITWDDVKWDYTGYRNEIVRGITNAVGDELKKLGLIAGYKLQKLVSPREYNFTNDSINVSFTLSASNVEKIQSYLNENIDAFTDYLKDRYTSCSGFISFHSNQPLAWVADNVIGEVLNDGHKLGSVLNFVLLNEDKEFEMTVYENLHCNGCYITASNYSKLVPERSHSRGMP